MATGTYRETLTSKGLQPFLWTQFLGAFNDNVVKIIVSFFAMRQLGAVDGVALVGAVFISPFLLFSGWAGHLADTFSKRRVLVSMKVLEVAAMALAIPALVFGRLDLMLGVLFLMATQSTFFSPAKYGILPELVPDQELSRANGLLEMSTFAAIIAGTWIGGELFEAWSGQPWRLGAVLVGIAVVGTLASLSIPAGSAARPGQRFAWNPFGEVGRGLSRVWGDRTLWITVVGVSYFWFLGALLQLALLPFGQETLAVGEAAATRLYTFLAIGIGVGSLVAGRLSGDKVELGLVPLGAIGLGVFSLLLVASVPSYSLAAVTLLLLGFSGGFFAVPLHAVLQQRPADHERGRVLATNNILNTIGILLASAVLWVLGSRMGLSIPEIFLLAGLFTLAGTVYVLARLPDFFVRFTLWLITHSLYRIRIVGRPHIPHRGPALLIANHVSMIDGALVGACVQRFIRFMVYGPYFHHPVLRPLLKRLHAIPVSGGNRREMVAALTRARAELEAGHVVCIFVEGMVSRTGNLLPFKRGFERIARGLDVPVIPVYLDRVWGSVFSFKHGKFFWKWPERIPYAVTVAFGAPLRSTATAAEARLAMMETGAIAMRHRRHATDLLHTAFMRTARRRWRQFAMADTTGQRLTYGRTLIGTLALARAIRHSTAGQDNVGLMLPASVGGAVANIATLAAGRTPVNLNFTIGPEALAAAIAEAGITTILTSRVFLKKANLAELPGMVYLEDVRKRIGTVDRLRALAAARLAPLGLLRRWYGGAGRTPDALATIIFSSGSTGVPKGVMLSHANVLANVDALAQIFPMSRSDCFVGVLPFFHSFGFTGTMWFPLLQGASVAFHPNPMDAKTIGDLAEAHRATMLISTPTFCQSYLRRCPPEQFAHLRFAIVGAEKLRPQLAQAFQEKYGTPLLEGYGCTEMAPVIAVNRPNFEVGDLTQIGTKPGSVGHPIPGVAAMVVDQETGEGPLVDRDGLLLVRGPNQMQGYLNQPERTAEVLRDGWYVTGDIAHIDEDGFIFITDRLARFSKIGGEMVPHVRVEEAINAALGDACSAVTAIPDPARGERLIAFHTRRDVSAEALWEQLCRTDLPKLWLPRRDGLLHLDEIPTLGTGKVDLRRLKSLAIELQSSN